MLKRTRHSFLCGVTATIVIFVPITTSLAEVTSIEEKEVLFLLELGTESEKVVDLKEALSVLGYSFENMDEQFDKETEETIKTHQQLLDLDVTGDVDEQLYFFILDEANTIESKEEVISEEEEELQITSSSISASQQNEVYFQSGMSDPKVIDIKIHLQIMGFKVSNNPNENYGPLTTQKVREFQEEFNLSITGITDDETFNLLEQLATGPLRKGMYREDVIKLKVDLGNAGFVVPGDTTTYYGPLTESRVKAFQQSVGITADGIAGSETLRKLADFLDDSNTDSLSTQEVINLKKNLQIMGFKVSDNPNGAYGPITTQRVREFQEAYGLPATGIANSTTIQLLEEVAAGPLRKGMYREDVVQLKIDLGKVGYTVPGDTTTYFGPLTESRVKSFQEANGLTVDGIAGSETLNKLIELIENDPIASMTREEVIKLKENLAIMGFRVSDNPNGNYGPITTRKVRGFQDAYGLNVTGIANKETVELLDELATRPLQNGMYHENVREIKINLGKLGFPVPGDTTTYYGPLTERSVREFQEAYGLSVNGIANNTTINKINEVIAGAFYNGTRHRDVITLKEHLAIMGFTVSNNPNQNYGPATTEQVREFQAANDLPKTGVADKRTQDLLKDLATRPLQKGMYHEDVREIKIQLGRAGFTVPGDTTTYFGPLTEARLKAFQEEYGLEPTGIANKATLDKLEEVAGQEITTYYQANVTLNQALNTQMNRSPQSDLYRNDTAFVSASYVNVAGTITGDGVNLRTGPNTTSSVSATVSRNTSVEIRGTVNGSSVSGNTQWYEIRYNGQTLYVHSSLAGYTARTTANVNVRERATANSHSYGVASNGRTLNVVNLGNSWHEVRYDTWRNAKREDVRRFLDPDQNDKFQHLLLSSSVGVSASQINRLLSGKGILDGQGQAFIDAGKEHKLNEVYLISHALLETGHGGSPLANGVEVGLNSSGNAVMVTSSNRGSLRNIRKTYNMFGIGAYDGTAVKSGSEYAYRAGWFTPEAAIVGGAKFIGERYVHNGDQQNTLYKMRWNPARPGNHQYATDIQWATKQVSTIKNMYNQLENPRLHFDVVQYR
ncbi:peptidoglycan-binding protein [Halalkalibacter sp. AB-rgal2]|uniref:peptidoglycan-binding protein n=1 Tax=Halalkalibacter sp. AB-rgal2 TaxID=3242695 RepID=UPI00359DA1FA